MERIVSSPERILSSSFPISVTSVSDKETIGVMLFMISCVSTRMKPNPGFYFFLVQFAPDVRNGQDAQCFPAERYPGHVDCQIGRAAFVVITHIQPAPGLAWMSS